MKTLSANDARRRGVNLKKKMNRGMMNSKKLNSGAPDSWFRSLIQTSNKQNTDAREVVLNAVISTWNDADIIGASVRNCFDQGCSRVFILDNASIDGSVAEALKAGAETGEVYVTNIYDDDLRIRKQNKIIKDITEKQKTREMWWLALDADEFPCRKGQTIIDMVSKLDREIRTVGSDAIDLYPTEGCLYEIGKHPAECFQYGINRREAAGLYCVRGHYKHVLFRLDDGIFDIAQTRGNHTLACMDKKPIFESRESMTLFHSPYRRYQETSARLNLLCGGYAVSRRSKIDDQVTGDNGSIKRWKTLKHVYAGEWDRVEMPHTQLYGRPVVGIALYPWRVLAPGLAGMFR